MPITLNFNRLDCLVVSLSKPTWSVPGALGIAAGLFLILLPNEAKALVVINIQNNDSGGVTATAHGTLRLDSFQTRSDATSAPAVGRINPFQGFFRIQPSISVDIYSNPSYFSGTITSWGSGSAVDTSLISGDVFELNLNPIRIWVPDNYDGVNGQELNAIATWEDISLDELIDGPGGSATLATYTYSWGSSASDIEDSIVVCIGTGDCDAQPIPAPLPIFGAAGAFGYSRKLRKRLVQRQRNVDSHPPLERRSTISACAGLGTLVTGNAERAR